MINLSNRIANQVYIVSIEGELIHSIAEKFREYITSEFPNQEVKGVLFNFDAVLKIDSSGIGSIVTVFKQLKKRQIKLILCQVHENIWEIFNMINLDKVIDIYPTEEEALQIFQDPKHRYVTLSVKIPQSFLDQLNVFSQNIQQTRTEIVINAIHEYMQDKKSKDSEQ